MFRNDLVMIDEIGFAPLDHTGCQLLFRLFAACYERRSIAIGSLDGPCPTARTADVDDCEDQLLVNVRECGTMCR